MRSNPQFPADLVKFAEKILNGKLQFLCSCLCVLFLRFYRNKQSQQPLDIRQKSLI